MRAFLLHVLFHPVFMPIYKAWGEGQREGRKEERKERRKEGKEGGWTDKERKGKQVWNTFCHIWKHVLSLLFNLKIFLPFQKTFKDFILEITCNTVLFKDPKNGSKTLPGSSKKRPWMSGPQWTFIGKNVLGFPFSLSSKLANVYKPHQLAVKASPSPWACGNLGISTRARQSHRPFLWKKSLTTKDKRKAGGRGA